MDWMKKIKEMFSPRGTMNRAVVDTTGMDEAMKETLGKMRGPLGAGRPDSATSGFRVNDAEKKRVNFGRGK